MDKPYIISISAISGGGKTSVARALANSLNKATALYFDDYEYLKQPENICEWIDNGSNPNEWDLSLLENDIYTAVQSGNYDYIIIDYPFGKNSEYKLGKIINTSVFIDTPLDIALAQRIVRDFSDNTKDDIIRELIAYPLIRKYFVNEDNLKRQYDFSIDGCLSINKIIEAIKAKI